MSEVLLKQISEELKGLKDEVSEVKYAQQLTNERLTNIEAKQQVIFEQTGKKTKYHTETISRIDCHQRFLSNKIVAQEMMRFISPG